MTLFYQQQGDVMMLLVKGDNMFGVAVSVTVALLMALIFVASSILNTLFLVIFIRRPVIRSISNRFIVSLTVLNLLSSWVMLPLVVGDTFLQAWESPFLCSAVNATAEFVTSASIFATLLIALDRFWAITKPLHYHMLISRRKSMLMIVCSWFLAIIIATLAVLADYRGHAWNVCRVKPNIAQKITLGSWTVQTWFVLVNLVTSFLVPMLVIFLLYVAIYRAAEENSIRTRRSSSCGSSLDVVVQGRMSRSISRSTSSRSTSSQFVSNIRHRLSNASLFLYKEEARAAKISVAVIVLFFFSWFPYYVTELLDSDLIQIVVPDGIHSVILVLALSNSTVSPYIYLYRSQRFRREVLHLFGMKKSQQVLRKSSRSLHIPGERASSTSSILSQGSLNSVIAETLRVLHPKRKVSNKTPFSSLFSKIIPLQESGPKSNSNFFIISDSTGAFSSEADNASVMPVEEIQCMLPQVTVTKPGL
ncbi:unnamed protein product [Meganyctiphanes norvegica]|uniref:G-protein coupled receptors family 1 profile domain-containing protein n=1 Tax=Meganyctiphanes norvegica TaxID=48144 RepID=A0AAV2S9E3_MEGNR